MNTLKRTLALVATLAMTATAFASCGDDKKEENKAETTTAAATEATTAADGGETTTTDGGNVGGDHVIDPSVKQDGDTFTVAAWNADDVPYLIAQWKGLSYDTIVEDLANNKVDGVNAIIFGVGGGEASERYDQLFNDGGDLDVYFCEADWALKYINDDTKTLDLAKLGLGDADFANMYDYTNQIGLTSDGVRKGVSWQAAAGGFAYRADLAEEYLGAKTPEEMQEKVKDWDAFVAAAKEVSEKSGQKVALADSLGGLWQAFACGRTQPWVKDNKLVIDDFCTKFGDTAKALWDCGGVTKNNQWSDEAWTAAGVSGNVMGYFVSTWGFGGFFLDAAGGEGGAQYGKWNVCEGPQSFYWGGTWIVVNPNTDNGKEAQEFILSATSDEAQMTAYAKNKPEYVNNSKVMDDLISSNTVFNEKISGNFKDGQNYFAELAKNAKSIDFKGLITPYDATVKADFVTAVREEYLEGGKSWDDAMDKFKDKVAEDVTTLDWDD
ncbi:ABC-type glycerol-3-phosphate transport system, substrate-binding protein [Ruminococcus flavefaciens]|uniref:ABC-type glycerol-3-phosphate transport system, substrate-binding protein n=1 Tax=Ruminococcus flavefaciens TaxID=1265 RepID=A0A1H6HUK6_RUMFL|nr:ABC transporter substrate-binding protein [Ruminococcus flavefaciens]SEH38773.1 ABC-type glycerol-3-phosphate transport system, substrate-binding protein [Ruminococcus flavefaciens]